MFYSLVVEGQKVKERPKDCPMKDGRYTAATLVSLSIPDRLRIREGG